MRKSCWWLLSALALAVLWLPMGARADTITTTVDGTAGPWVTISTLNGSYSYGTTGVTAPDVIDSSSGIAFTTGDSLAVSYVSKTVNTGDPYSANVDADGQLAQERDYSTGSTDFPSYYMGHSTTAYLSELVGTFADSGGAIVGTPFVLGDSWNGTIPAGADELLLGVNDNMFSDNSGSWTLSVTENGPTTNVPEPSALLLLGIGLILLGGMQALRHMQGRQQAAAQRG